MRFKRLPLIILILGLFLVNAFAYDPKASQISNIPAGNISSTNVQAALNELDSEKQASGSYLTDYTVDAAHLSAFFTGASGLLRKVAGTPATYNLDTSTYLTAEADTLASVMARGATTGVQLTSTLAIGTSPFAITSTTVNTNLNADLLDGSHASAFALVGGTTYVGTTAIALNRVSAAQALTGITGLSPAVDSTAAFQFYKADGTTAFVTLDTTNARVGIGTVSPTAVLHLKAGTATASTAPLKFNSGPLLTTAEAGVVEFLTDKYYGTITTGAARKTFAFLESPVFTTPTLGAATATSIATGATTFDLLNTVATTLNIGGAATYINMGAASGLLTWGKNTGSGAIAVNGGAGSVRDLRFQSAGVGRWNVRSNSDTESGSNTGSSFLIQARDDAGAFIDDPFIIARVAGGTITLARPVAINNATLSTDQTTFNLVNTTATTLNLGGAATTIGIGAATGTTTIKNALTVTGATILNNTLHLKGSYGYLYSRAAAFQPQIWDSFANNFASAADFWRLFNNGNGWNFQSNATGSLVTTFSLGTGGNCTILGDLAVNGSDITSTGTGTGTLFNTNITTLNLGGAATTMTIGAATNVLTLRGDTQVGGFGTATATKSSAYPILTTDHTIFTSGNTTLTLPAVSNTGQEVIIKKTDTGTTTTIQGSGYTTSSATSGTVAVNDTSTGTIAWTNVTNVYSSNNVYATVALSKDGISNYIKLTGFGFALPATATSILGIKVEVEGNQSAGSGTIVLPTVRIVKANVISGSFLSNLSSWSASDVYYQIPTTAPTTELWGLTWAYTDINASTFGVAVAVSEDGGLFSATASVDHIRITVYYTDALIDGSAQKTLTTQYQSRILQSDGTNWHIVGGFL